MMRRTSDTLDESAGAVRVPPPSGARMLVVEHRDGSFVVPLFEGESVVVGREPPSDLRPRSRRLSRRHARVSCLRGEVWLEDLGSTNGTFVGGSRVEGKVRLTPTDVARLGSVRVVLAADRSEVTVAGLERFLDGVADELQRASMFRRTMAVAVVRPRGPAGVAWLGRVREGLRSVDRLASLGVHRVVVLLPEVDRDQARRLLAMLAHDVQGEVGLCMGPGERTAEGMLAAAKAALGQSGGVVREVEGGVHPEPGPELVVVAEAMEALFTTVEQVAASRLSVLIHGETGSGKEVVAQRLHGRSDRSDGPLRSVNCGAIPPTLLESTLFGHERGAFTGAEQTRPGLFEEAEGGTVFLDEIGELSPPAQVALLRVLEARTVQRVGSSREIPVDVRVVAATHRDLRTLCDEGRFRSDLFYRLNAVTLRVPPLRERREEVEPLVHHFVRQANALHGRQVHGPTEAALRLLQAYDWPGNVRELRNVVERAVVVTSRSTFDTDDLGALGDLPRPDHRQTPAIADRVGPRRIVALDLKQQLRAFEASLIRGAVAAADGNQSQAAELLRMPRRTLVYKLSRLGAGEGFPASDVSGAPTPLRQRLERYEWELIDQAMAFAEHDVGRAAQLLAVQRRTLAAKLRKRRR